MTAPPRADPHVEAFLDRVRAALGPAGVTVYDGEATGAPPARYLVLYPDPGTVSAAAADGDQQDLLLTVQATACGPTRRDADAVQDAVRQAVVGEELAVTGRYCWPIEQILTLPTRRDDTAKPASNLPTFYSIAQYRWLTVPA